MTFNERVSEKVNEDLKRCFVSTIKDVCGTEPTNKKIIEIQIGKPVFHNGLQFVVSRKNGITTLSDGTKYDFLTGIKECLLTE